MTIEQIAESIGRGVKSNKIERCIICGLPVTVVTLAQHKINNLSAQSYLGCPRCGSYTASVDVCPIFGKFTHCSKEVALVSHYVKTRQIHGNYPSLDKENVDKIISGSLPNFDDRVSNTMLCFAEHIKDKPISETIAFPIDAFCEIYKRGVEGKCTHDDLTKDRFKLCFEVMAKTKAQHPEDIKYVMDGLVGYEYISITKSGSVLILPFGLMHIESIISASRPKEIIGFKPESKRDTP